MLITIEKEIQNSAPLSFKKKKKCRNLVRKTKIFLQLPGEQIILTFLPKQMPSYPRRPLD
jgi:hypothetical protein